MVWKLLLSLLFLVLIALLSGCANKRFYFGMDDYGVTAEHQTNWTTEGENYAKRK